jgi:hypothetical protein
VGHRSGRVTRSERLPRRASREGHRPQVTSQVADQVQWSGSRRVAWTESQGGRTRLQPRLFRIVLMLGPDHRMSPAMPQDNIELRPTKAFHVCTERTEAWCRMTPEVVGVGWMQDVPCQSVQERHGTRSMTQSARMPPPVPASTIGCVRSSWASARPVGSGAPEWEAGLSC